MNKIKKLNIYVQYSILFLIVFILCFGFGLFNGVTFVKNRDAICQHLAALTYYGNYLRDLFGSILAGHPSLPEWAYNLGEGGDVVSILHYYVIGDPFAFFSFLCPSEYMYVFYCIMLGLRLYLSGMAFVWLLSSKDSPVGEKLSKVAILIGTMVYVFSYWGIYDIYRHPYFINPLINLPLLILGVEKVIKKKKPYLFILAVFVSGISNFYFFYMLVIMVVIYVAIRLVYEYKKNIKDMMKALGFIFCYAIVGVMLAAFIVIPVMMFFLSDTRMASGQNWEWFYNPNYYMAIPAKFFSGSETEYACLGFGGLGVISLVMLCMDRGRHLVLKIASVIALLGITFSFIGKFMNGMSYAANRWTFLAALIAGIVVAVEWERLISLDIKKAIPGLVTLVVFLVLCICLPKSRDLYAYIGIGIGFVMLLIVAIPKKPSLNTKSVIVFTLAIANIASNGIGNYRDYAVTKKGNTLMTPKQINDYYYHTEASSVHALGDKSNYRFSGPTLTRNTGLIVGESSTQYYWSNSNPHMNKFRDLSGIDEYRLFWYNGYGNNSLLMSLAGVKYYVVKELSEGDDEKTITGWNSEKVFRTIPEGFKYLKTVDGYEIYENENYLPLIYAYDNSISETEWMKYDFVQRNQIMKDYVVLEDKYNETVAPNISFDDLHEGTLNFMNFDGSANVGINGIVTLKDNALIMVSVPDDVENGEKYIIFQDYSYKKPDRYINEESSAPLNFAVDGGVKTFIYYAKNYNWYNGRQSFSVDLGYRQNPLNSFSMYVLREGTYAYDYVKYYSVSRDNLKQDIDELRVKGDDSLKLETDKVTAHISLDKAKTVVVAVPYSEGWTVKVDGKDAQILNANLHYLGVNVEAGEHDIEFTYKNPYLSTGFIISGVGILVLAAIIVLDKKKKI